MDILLVPKHAFQHFLIVLTMFLVNVYVVFNNVFDELPFFFTQRMVVFTWIVHQIFKVINMR